MQYIRLAHLKDAKELLILQHKVMDLYRLAFCNENVPDALKEGLDEIKESIESRTVYICELVDKTKQSIIGSIRISQKDEHLTHRQISRFIVHPDYQSNGVGSKLLDFVIQKVKKELPLEEELTLRLITAMANEKGIKLYERFGFHLSEVLTDQGYKQGLYECSISADVHKQV